MTGVYLIQGSELVEFTESPFENEFDFQELLEKYPRLLGGDEFDAEVQQRWLLIKKEAPVPDEEGGADRWSADHLFIDQNAIPTIVEVKRRSDSRLRRKVIGQMMDYAANAVVYWPIERLRAFFEATCDAAGRDPADVLGSAIGEDADPDEFWQRAKTNLQAGRVRLIFVADELSTELRRIIEFLNKQMDPAEVLGVEIRHYTDPSKTLKTLLPQVVGRTAEAEGKKGSSTTASPWDEETFFEKLSRRATAAEVTVAKKLLTFGPEISRRDVEWGKGTRRGSFTARLHAGGEHFSLFSVYTTGQISFNIGWNKAQHLDADGTSLSEKYRRRVTTLFDVAFDQRSWEAGWPMMDLAQLVPDNAASFESLMKDFVDDILAAQDRKRVAIA